MTLLTVTSIATLLSGIGACVSALATFVTLREMKKQREAAYCPDIVFFGFHFSGQEKANCLEGVTNQTFKIRNVGMGAAKNITITTTTNLKKLLPEVNSLLLSNNSSAEVCMDKNFTIKTSSEESEVEQSVSIIDKAFIQYMLPGMEECTEILIPEYLCSFAGFITKQAFKDALQEFKTILQKIYIVVDAAYTDIGGKQHTTTSILRFLDYQYNYVDGSYHIRFK